jgi:hypothetical protein
MPNKTQQHAVNDSEHKSTRRRTWSVNQMARDSRRDKGSDGAHCSISRSTSTSNQKNAATKTVQTTDRNLGKVIKRFIDNLAFIKPLDIQELNMCSCKSEI